LPHRRQQHADRQSKRAGCIIRRRACEVVCETETEKHGNTDQNGRATTDDLAAQRSKQFLFDRACPKLPALTQEELLALAQSVERNWERDELERERKRKKTA
jgi:hypothetical protein